MKDKLGRSSALILLVHERSCWRLHVSFHKSTRVCWRTCLLLALASFIRLPTLSSHSWSEEKACSFKNKNWWKLGGKKERSKGWFRIQIQIFERAWEGAAGISCTLPQFLLCSPAKTIAMTAVNHLLFQAVCVPSGTVMRWWVLCALQMLWDDRWAADLMQEKMTRTAKYHVHVKLGRNVTWICKLPVHTDRNDVMRRLKTSLSGETTGWAYCVVSLKLGKRSWENGNQFIQVLCGLKGMYHEECNLFWFYIFWLLQCM